MNTKKLVLFCLLMILCLLVCGCGKSSKVQSVESKISKLGDVTIEDGEVINDALAAYNSLTEKEKTEVDAGLAQALLEAETKFEALKRVSAVETKIQNIGTVSTDSHDAISVALDAFNKLSDEDKMLMDEKFVEILRSSETEYDDLVSTEIIKKIQSTPTLTLEEAQEIALSHETKSEGLLKLQKDLSELCLCQGTFYQNGKYKAEVRFYLQYGEYWFELDYEGYTGTVSEQKLSPDGENGFYFKSATKGTHINYFSNTIDRVNFELRFGEEKMYISWGSSEYYLGRSK